MADAVLTTCAWCGQLALCTTAELEEGRAFECERCAADDADPPTHVQDRLFYTPPLMRGQLDLRGTE